jgi:adenosylhomocysteine nucleosidase
MSDRDVVVAFTGVGKVNAAMTTTLLLEHFDPCEVIFTGIAGAVDPNLSPGDIVIAEKTAYHDMGTVWPEGFFPKGIKNPLDGWHNPVFFDADKRLFALAQAAAKKVDLAPVNTGEGERKPNISPGIIVTGDVFVASETKCAELRKTFQADAVEMEGAAVAQICYQRHVPCLVIRSISDNADAGARADSMMFHMMAAKNSASLVSDIVSLLKQPAEKPKR